MCRSVDTHSLQGYILEKMKKTKRNLPMFPLWAACKIFTAWRNGPGCVAVCGLSDKMGIMKQTKVMVKWRLCFQAQAQHKLGTGQDPQQQSQRQLDLAADGLMASVS
jgi:hypothetical protein